MNLTYEQLDAYQAPQDGNHYHWIADRNLGKQGWTATDIKCGDLTLCKIPMADWHKIAVKDEVNKIQTTLNQLKKTTIPMGADDCDKFDIYIKDEIFDEVYNQFQFPDYVRVKRVLSERKENSAPSGSGIK